MITKVFTIDDPKYAGIAKAVIEGMPSDVIRIEIFEKGKVVPLNILMPTVEIDNLRLEEFIEKNILESYKYYKPVITRVSVYHYTRKSPRTKDMLE